ncbi:class I adenylate-forming enzyme family protein [Patulibacter sp. S7RM1-6]
MTESHWRPTGTRAARRETFGALLEAAAARRPDGLALVQGAAAPEGGARVTYRELLDRGRRIATVLLRDFSPGEHVALWAPNSVDWIAVQAGAGLAGLVLVTVNPAYRATELAHTLRQSRASGLFHAEQHRGRDLRVAADEVAPTLPHLRTRATLAELLGQADGLDAPGPLPALAADDLAQIQYTSGTTGIPKGAMLTHGGISAAYAQVVERAEADGAGPPVWLNAMPLFHCGGAGMATVGTLAHAGTQVVMPEFDAGLFLRLVERERATITLAVPTMLIALLEHPDRPDRDLASLRTVITGGATVPAEMVRRVRRELRAQVLITFGQTECHGTMSMSRPEDDAEDVATTVGLPLDHVEVRIADPSSGATLPVGASGEIMVRGPQVMAGYHDAPAETARAIEDGWLRFGDLGSMDERGYLRVHGRLKEMVIRGGENIYPREIEDVLVAHAGVSDVAVVGVPDETWGEEVAAVVRPVDPAPDPHVLADYCRERLAGYKCPRVWFYVDAMPTTPSGKVQKHQLARMVTDGRLRPVAAFRRKVGERTVVGGA